MGHTDTFCTGTCQQAALDKLLLQDMFTSLTSATKPHHMVGGGQVILGYSHFGMLAAASWVFQETKAKLEEALQSQPAYRLQVVGHSLGGGTSALLTARSRIFSTGLCGH